MNATLAAGTYRCRDIAGAVSAALDAGVEWIDTAPNYANGTAETRLRPVLAARPGLGVSTKVGFVPRRDWEEAAAAGVLPGSGADRGHCLSRSYVAWQLARSRIRLGRAPELVFVHNPEHAAVGRDSVLSALTEVFGELECAVDAGLTSGYGVATWTGLSSGLLTVSDLTALAQRAGGPRHHFKALQLPVSLVHLAGVAEALDGGGPLHDAREAGLHVFASAPLGGGDLPRLMTPELVQLIAPSASAAQAALMVALSAPGVSRVLLSASTRAHWADAESAAAWAPLPHEHLRRAIDVLGT
ncbi:aldo/keto reductase [Streptomyces sp. NBC_01217]|uniref:aldo/keto reductase n=1 Tax=Streptomyces sp. NBC_01217 TaxID=2903779 RepID=UPI002E121680|nr:aldo/keto reductase [Streptomyces sp. NBC_01217]